MDGQITIVSVAVETPGWREARTHWRLLAAGILGVLLFSLPPYTTGLFIGPLQRAFGWSRTELSWGATLMTLGMAFGGLGAGLLVRRVPPVVLAAVGGLAYVGGFAGLSRLNESLPAYWSLSAAMTVLGAGCSPVVFAYVLAPAFHRTRGAALGAIMVGAGLASSVAPVVLTPLIASQGWRTAFLALAGLALVAGALVVSLLTGASRPHEAPSASERQARTSSGSVLARLLAAVLMVSVAVGGAVVHLAPVLIDSGAGPAQVAGLASLMGLTLIVSRLASGVAADRFEASRVAAAVMAAAGLGFAAVALSRYGWLALLPVSVGVALGAEIDLVAYLASRHFPGPHYGRTFGILYFVFQLGLAGSPLLYGAIADAWGGYGIAFGLSAICLLSGAALFASLPKLKVDR